MAANNSFTVYGARVPQSFDVRTLSKRLCTTKWDVEHLVKDWLCRRWIRRIHAGHFRQTRKFGINDLAHLQQEVFPRARWTRRDLINARLDTLIEQHNHRRNKDRRAGLADEIEELLTQAVMPGKAS